MTRYFALAVIGLALPFHALPQSTKSAKNTASSTTRRVKGLFKRRHTPKIDDTKRKALSIPTGSPVKVKSTDGSQTAGTLSAVTDQSITVRTEDDKAQQLPFDRIAGLKKTGSLKRGVSAPHAAINHSLAEIPAGSPLTLKLADKSKLSGRYQGKTAEGVKMQVPEGDRLAERTVPLGQIAGVKQPKGKFFSKPSLQSPDMVKKTLTGIPIGSPLSMKTLGGKTFDGKLTGLTGSGFSMQTLDAGNIVNKKMSFDEAGSVKPEGLGIKQHIPGLHPPGLKTDTQLKSAALGIPVGSPVTLHMPDGTRSTGKLTGVSNDGIKVQSVQAGDLVTNDLTYDQVGSIKQGLPVTAATRAKKLGIAGAMVIVTGVVSGALANAF